MKKYSVFTLGYGWHYYLTHPWKFFTEISRNFRAGWQRATRGWCASDTWDWDNWFISVVPDMLRHLADYGHGYPGQDPFDEPEKWHEWLYNMAQLIETASEEWQNAHNEYYEEYINEIMEHTSITEEIDAEGNWHHIWHKQPEIGVKYSARAKELAEQGEKNIQYVFENLGKYFHFIWD